MHHPVTKHRGIITLYRHQKAAFAITSRRGPTPKAVKAQIADLPAGSSGNVLVELDEVNRFFFEYSVGFFFFLRLYLFLERGEGKRERGGEKQ